MGRSHNRKQPRSGCHGFGRAWSRRDFMMVGMVGGLGLTLGEFFRLRAFADQKHYASVEGPAKSIIQIFLPGGLAAQESFDPKPYSPVEYRGPIGSIETLLHAFSRPGPLPYIAFLQKLN